VVTPPTRGAAMRLATSEPAPVAHMTGNRPKILAKIVHEFGGANPLDRPVHHYFLQVFIRCLVSLGFAFICGQYLNITAA